MKTLNDEIERQMYHQAYDQIRLQVEYLLDRRVYGQLYQLLYDQVHNQVDENLR